MLRWTSCVLLRELLLIGRSESCVKLERNLHKDEKEQEQAYEIWPDSHWSLPMLCHGESVKASIGDLPSDVGAAPGLWPRMFEGMESSKRNVSKSSFVWKILKAWLGDLGLRPGLNLLVCLGCLGLWYFIISLYKYNILWWILLMDFNVHLAQGKGSFPHWAKDSVALGSGWGWG